MKKATRKRKLKKYPILIQYYSSESAKESLMMIAKMNGLNMSALLRNMVDACIAEYEGLKAESGELIYPDQSQSEVVQ